MVDSACTWISLLIIVIGSFGNWLCICVFSRKRFRSSILTPFFIALLVSDCMYLIFRVLKLLYYQQTLFHSLFIHSSCASSLLTRFYGYFTQYAPQVFVPFCHYEFYIRFSLLLMCFLVSQRSYDMCCSSNRLLFRKSSSKVLSYALIIIAVVLSYMFELAGLSIFCSHELSPNLAYQWYSYLYSNLTNETSHLITFMMDQSANQSEIDCVEANNSLCSREQITQIARKLFSVSSKVVNQRRWRKMPLNGWLAERTISIFRMNISTGSWACVWNHFY